MDKEDETGKRVKIRTILIYEEIVDVPGEWSETYEPYIEVINRETREWREWSESEKTDIQYIWSEIVEIL